MSLKLASLAGANTSTEKVISGHEDVPRSWKRSAIKGRLFGELFSCLLGVNNEEMRRKITLHLLRAHKSFATAPAECISYEISDLCISLRRMD